MISNPHENKPNAQNTSPLQTPALFQYILSFMTLSEFPELEQVSKYWKDFLVKVIWKNLPPKDFDTYLKTHFFTMDDVEATLTNKDEAYIFNTLEPYFQNRGFAFKTDLAGFKSKQKIFYSVHQTILERLNQEHLHPYQKIHLRSARIVRAVMAKKLTIEQAIKRVDLLKIGPKNFNSLQRYHKEKLIGIYMGLTLEEMEPGHFGLNHLEYIFFKGYDLNKVIKLDSVDILWEKKFSTRPEIPKTKGCIIC
jgi:hypothetical protein